MTYKIDLSVLPEITEAQDIERDTVWKCSPSKSLCILMLKGACAYLVGTVERVVKAGDCIVIPRGVEYERRPMDGGDAKFICYHFTSELTPVTHEQRDAMLRSLSTTSGTVQQILVHDVTTLDNAESMEALLREGMAELSGPSPLRSTAASLLFSRFLVELSKAQLREMAYASDIAAYGKAIPAPLKKALDYIKENYDRRIGIPELCQAANVTPQHLIRLFNKYVGSSPIKYINRSKILSAVELLRSTEKSVKEISYELGFENPNYFSRIFARELGMSPIEKRENIRSYEKKDFGN